MLDAIQVIIPALDEEESVGWVVSGLRARGLTRIRVVDNGSTDRTVERAREAGAEVITAARRGYGQACWTGAQALDEAVRWLLFVDADGSDNPADIARLWEAAENGAELVLGDRRATAAGRAVMTPVQRFGNGLATTLIWWGWRHRYHDLGPLRLIRREVLGRIDMRDRGFGWTIEMQVRAVEEGARIVELPVTYRKRAGGKSKISGTVRGSVAAGVIILSTLARLWRVRRRRLRGGHDGMPPTLVMVLRAPVAGEVKTRLAAETGDAEAVRIYRWLVERQMEAIPPSWAVEVHYTPTEAGEMMQEWLGLAPQRSYWPQGDGGLGERMDAATQAAFGRGAAAVILIGGDCAELDRTVLHRAERLLVDHNVVMGPAADGGYYLLGLKAPRPELLEGIRWSTSVVARQTRQRIEAAGLRYAELDVLHDVDTAADWRRVRPKSWK